MSLGTDEDPTKQIDRRLLEQAEEYASCDEDSKELNDRRKKIRDTIEGMGIHPLAWQHAINMVKRMTPGERRDYQVSYQRVIGVIGDKQADLFPEQTDVLRKREERRAATPEAQKAAADAKTDANPRSDPKKGGAGTVVPMKPAVVGEGPGTMMSGVPTSAETAREQAEGDAVLAGAKGELTGAAEAQQQAAATGEGLKVDSVSEPVPPEPPAEVEVKKPATPKEKLLSGASTPKKPSQSEIAKRKLETAGIVKH